MNTATCIIALKAGDTLYMAGDSAGVGGYSIRTRRDSKVFRKGEYLYGFTSSFRMGQILRFGFSPPALTEGQDVYEFMCTGFVNALRRAMRDGGAVKVENSVEEGGTFLVGFRGRLFVVYDDFQVGEPDYDFYAVGCGEEYAMGAMRATDGQAAPARLYAALSIAEEFSAGVRRPFRYVTSAQDDVMDLVEDRPETQPERAA